MVCTNTAMEQRNDNPTDPHARRCAMSCEYRWPRKPFTSTAVSGKSGISNTSTSNTFTPLPFQKIHFIDVGGDLSSEHDNDNGQAYGRFAGRDSDDEQGNDLTRHRVQIMRKGHQIDMGGIQHDLDGHQHDDEIPTDQHADQSRDKQHGA